MPAARTRPTTSRFFRLSWTKSARKLMPARQPTPRKALWSPPTTKTCQRLRTLSDHSRRKALRRTRPTKLTWRWKRFLSTSATTLTKTAATLRLFAKSWPSERFRWPLRILELNLIRLPREILTLRKALKRASWADLEFTLQRNLWTAFLTSVKTAKTF